MVHRHITFQIYLHFVIPTKQLNPWGKTIKKKHLKILLDSELSLLHIIPVAIAPVYDLINLGWKLWRPAWIRRKGLEQNKNQTVNKMHAFVLSEGHTG